MQTVESCGLPFHAHPSLLCVGLVNDAQDGLALMQQRQQRPPQWLSCKHTLYLSPHQALVQQCRRLFPQLNSQSTGRCPLETWQTLPS